MRWSSHLLAKWNTYTMSGYGQHGAGYLYAMNTRKVLLLFFVAAPCILIGQCQDSFAVWKSRANQERLARNRVALQATAEKIIACPELHSQDSSIYYWALGKLGFALGPRSPVAADSLLSLAIARQEKIGLSTELCDLYYAAGIVKSNLSQFDEADLLYSSSLDYLSESSIVDKEEMEAWINYSAGFNMIRKGVLPEAMAYLNQSLSAEFDNDLLRQAIYNQQGNIDYLRRNFLEAKKHYLKSIRLAEEKFPTRANYTGMGNVMHNLNQQDSAIYYHKLQLERNSERKNRTYYASFYNIARAYAGKEDYMTSDSFSTVLLQMANELNHAQLKGNAYEMLLSNATLVGDYMKAKTLVDSAFKYVPAEFDNLVRLNQIASVVAEHFGEDKKALHYIKENKRFSDSLRSQSVNEQLNQQKLDFLAQQKNAEIASIEQDNMIQQYRLQQRIIIAVLLLLCSLLAFLFYYYYQRESKLKLKSQKEKIENTLLRSQMNPHFIFNALSSIQNFFYNESDIEQGMDYMSKLAQLMRQVLEHSREEFITLEDEIDSLRNYLELQNMRYSQTFDFSIEIDPAINPAETLIPPLIAQPLVENAIEHGMIYKVKDGEVKIIFEDDPMYLILKIQDNGNGIIDKDRVTKMIGNGIKKKSLSTLISRERLSLLSNSYQKEFRLFIDNAAKGGTHVVVQLPKVTIVE